MCFPLSEAMRGWKVGQRVNTNKKRKHMKNPKHTQGEWRQFPKHKEAPHLDKDNTYRAIVSGNGFYDKQTQSGFDLTGYVSEADTKLIAAAPDLLRACQLLLNAVKHDEIKLFPEKESTPNYIQLIENAVKKATT